MCVCAKLKWPNAVMNSASVSERTSPRIPIANISSMRENPRRPFLILNLDMVDYCPIVGCGVGVGDGLTVGDGVGVGDGLTVGDGVGVGGADGLTVGVGVGDGGGGVGRTGAV